MGMKIKYYTRLVLLFFCFTSVKVMIVFIVLNLIHLGMKIDLDISSRDSSLRERYDSE